MENTLIIVIAFKCYYGIWKIVWWFRLLKYKQHAIKYLAIDRIAQINQNLNILILAIK